MGYLRFNDLRARGIVKSRPALKGLQEKSGFPSGRLIGPNTRAWDEETEIAPWLASRPTAPKPTPRSPGRPRKADTSVEA
jgi:predicted DNA-binding transcriptional regulator AlpA